MEMLAVSSLLSSNLWTILINGFAKWIVNYGWTIIVFTICLKLVLSPLDVLQRVFSGKQARITNAMQPELAALQKKYADNKEKLNQETNKVYKKYNTGMGGMCVVLLVTMVLNLVILFTLYSTVRNLGNEKLYTSYQELETSYVTAKNNADISLSDEEKNTLLVTVVEDKYEELSKQNSWLWVKNVWKSDTKTSQFVDFESYAKYRNLSEADKQTAKENYDFITSTINAKNNGNDINGYYILIILAVAISFLTQFLTSKLLGQKGQKMPMMNKVMLAVVPITMLILASTSNVIYTLYIITNSLITAIISTILSLIMKKTNKKYEGHEDEILLKKKNVEVVEYSRNYKK